MLRVIVTLLVVVTVVGARSYARACSCAMPPAPPEALVQADAVFEGELVDSCTDGAQATTRTWRFRVLRAWKGVAADTIVAVRTATSSAACGYDTGLPVGTVMLIYATNSEQVLTTNICTRTRLSSEAADDFAPLGTPSSASGGGVPPQTDASCQVVGASVDAGTDAADARDSGPGDSSGCTVSGSSLESGRLQFLTVTLGLLGFLGTRNSRRRR